MWKTYMFFLLCVSPSVWATKVEPMPLKEIVRQSTQTAVATIESVYGRTKVGAVVIQGQFRTGPGLGNVLVARMRILRVLSGNKLHVGEVQDLAFWPMWYMDTDLAAKIAPYPVILLLKESGAELIPVFAPTPWIDGREEREVLTQLKTAR